MSINAPSRAKNHWSVRLRIQRPNTRGRIAILVLALVQTVLLALTASSLATTGSLYACAMPCGTPAQPTTPFLAAFFAVAILLLPLVIGALARSWQEAVTLAAAPALLAVVFNAGMLLASAPIFDNAARSRSHPTPTGHFGAPFWLDAGHLMPLLLALVLFAALGWFGWLVRRIWRTP
jgi:hypothetical protein